MLNPIEESHAELAALKQRREKLEAETDTLDRDLAAAIQRARAARLPMREIAEHAGVERTILYNALRRAKPPHPETPAASRITAAHDPKCRHNKNTEPMAMRPDRS